MSVLVKSSYHTSVFSNRTITWLTIDVYEQQQFWSKIILEWETDNTCMGFNSHDDVWAPDRYLISNDRNFPSVCFFPTSISCFKC